MRNHRLMLQGKDIVIETMRLTGSAEAVAEGHSHHGKISFLDPSMHKSAAVIDATKLWLQFWHPHGEFKKLDDSKYKRPENDWTAADVDAKTSGLSLTTIKNHLKSLLSSDKCFDFVFTESDKPDTKPAFLESHFQNADMPFCNRMWSYVLQLMCKKYGKNAETVHEKFPTTPRFTAQPAESPASPPKDEVELLGAASRSEKQEENEEEEKIEPRKKRQKKEKVKVQSFVVTLESRFAMGYKPDKQTTKQIFAMFKSIQISPPAGLRITTANMVEPPPERLARTMSLAHVRKLKNDYVQEAHQGLDHKFYCNLQISKEEEKKLLKSHNNSFDALIKYLRQQLTDAGEGATTDKKYELETIGGNHSRQAKQELAKEYPQDAHLHW